MERMQADYLCGQKKVSSKISKRKLPIEWENREEKTEYPSYQE